MGEIPTRCSASSFVTAYLFKSLELSHFRTKQDSQYQNCRLPCYPLSGPGPDARPFVGLWESLFDVSFRIYVITMHEQTLEGNSGNSWWHEARCMMVYGKFELVL